MSFVSLQLVMDDADAFINGVFAFPNNGKETRQDKENHRDQPSNNSMNDADDDDVFDDNSTFTFASMNEKNRKQITTNKKKQSTQKRKQITQNKEDQSTSSNSSGSSKKKKTKKKHKPDLSTNPRCVVTKTQKAAGASCKFDHCTLLDARTPTGKVPGHFHCLECPLQPTEENPAPRIELRWTHTKKQNAESHERAHESKKQRLAKSTENRYVKMQHLNLSMTGRAKKRVSLGLGKRSSLGKSLDSSATSTSSSTSSSDLASASSSNTTQSRPPKNRVPAADIMGKQLSNPNRFSFQVPCCECAPDE
jgi:hypothetical protein